MKTCPFCGTDQEDKVLEIFPEYELSPNLNLIARHCKNCGATGPDVLIEDYENDEEAQKAADKSWNERA